MLLALPVLALLGCRDGAPSAGPDPTTRRATPESPSAPPSALFDAGPAPERDPFQGPRQPPPPPSSSR